MDNTGIGSGSSLGLDDLTYLEPIIGVKQMRPQRHTLTETRESKRVPYSPCELRYGLGRGKKPVTKDQSDLITVPGS
jgi:hypothetical protein